MRRRILAAFFVLDGLCALAAPVFAPALLVQPSPFAEPAATYVEIAGMCVEEQPLDGADLAGRPVAMSFCTGA